MTQTASPTTHVKFVETHFNVRNVSGEEYDVLCPLHGDRNASMRINVAKGVFFCHGCHLGGTIAKLAKLIGVKYRWDRTEEALFTLTQKLNALRTKQTGADPTPAWLEEGYLDNFVADTGYWSEECGFSDDIIQTFDLRYDIMNNAAIIPIRDIHGHLLGVTRRFLDENAMCKYKDPKGFDKKHNLFASWFAVEDPRSTVVVVEGPKDAMKVWQAGHMAVAQYGTYLTLEQIKVLKRMGTTTLIGFYDNDKGGKKSFAAMKGFVLKRHNGVERWEYKPERDLRRHFVVRRVRYGSVNKKDPGAMSSDEINDRIARSRYVM